MGMFEKIQELIGQLAGAQNQLPRAKPIQGTLIHNSPAHGTLRHNTRRSVAREFRRKGVLSARQQRKVRKLRNKVYREARHAA